MKVSIRELILGTVIVGLAIALCISRWQNNDLKVFRGRAIVLEYLLEGEGIEIEWEGNNQGVKFRNTDNLFGAGSMTTKDLKHLTTDDLRSD